MKKWSLKSWGGALLFVLVFVMMVLAMLSASSQWIARQFRIITDRAQYTQAFHLAEGGVHYTIWALNVAKADPANLQNVNDVEVRSTFDDSVIGTYDVSYEFPDPDTVLVTSVGKDAVKQNAQETIMAIFELQPGGLYKVTSWDHNL